MSVHRALESITLGDVALYGGKAARLGEAARLGVSVPRAVVLPTDLYRRFMRQGGLQGEIGSILGTLQPNAWAHFQATEWAIQSAFQMRRTAAQVVDAILDAARSLNAARLAVRSSATNEDSPQNSFVGQHYACILDGGDEAGVVEAVRRCWMSLFSAEALSYAQHFGVDLLSSSMAVLIQEAIEPELRGALFTADPISGSPDAFVLEIEATPAAERDSLIGVHALDPYAVQAGEPSLWGELRHIGLLLDEHLRQYQTIEWAWAGGTLYALRVRPTSTVPPYLPRVQHHLGPDTYELRKPRHVTPRQTLPHTWYHMSRADALRRAFLGRASRLFMPQTERKDVFLCGYCYSCWPGASAADGSALRGVLATHATLQRVLAAERLDREVRPAWAALRPRLDALALRDLRGLSRAELAGFVNEVSALGVACVELSGRVGEGGALLTETVADVQRRWLREPVDVEALLQVSTDARSRRDVALCRVARKTYAGEEQRRAAVDSFYRQYRHHYLQGDVLGDCEDIGRVREGRAAMEHDLESWAAPETLSAWDEQSARAQMRREVERKALSQLRGLRRVAFRRLLRLALRYVPWRVDRDEGARLCLLLERDAALEAGRRMVGNGLGREPADAFYLTQEELLRWLQGQASSEELGPVLEERRALWRRWARYAPPLTYAEPRPEPARLAPAEASVIMALAGRPIRSGVVDGRARVIRTPAEAGSVLPGEVLVCREPSFELSPLFAVVAAVVAETGGLLSHGAVLVREYGVPAVFGVSGALSELHSGDLLHVDGDRGTVSRSLRAIETRALERDL